MSRYIVLKALLVCHTSKFKSSKGDSVREWTIDDYTKATRLIDEKYFTAEFMLGESIIATATVLVSPDTPLRIAYEESRNPHWRVKFKYHVRRTTGVSIMVKGQ